MTPLTRRLFVTARILHIDLTIVGLGMLLFFAGTGFMLNHPGLFGIENVSYRDVEGQVPVAILNPVDDLAVVEHLREVYDVRGAVRAFDSDEHEVRVVFRRPGHYLADAVIDRSTGALQMTIETNGITTLLVDLHRGSESGAVWSVVMIDAAAVLLVAVSLTGFAMLVILPRYRIHALAGLAGSAAVATTVYFLFVP